MAGFGERNWEVRQAGAPWPHPCRHCAAPIIPGETFFLEAARPWIAVHTECIEMLAWSVRQRLTAIAEAAATSTEDETVEALLSVQPFLEGAERWYGHTKESRAIYDRLVKSKVLGAEVEPDPPPKPPLKPRRLQRPIRKIGDA